MVVGVGIFPLTPGAPFAKLTLHQSTVHEVLQ